MPGWCQVLLLARTAGAFSPPVGTVVVVSSSRDVFAVVGDADLAGLGEVVDEVMFPAWVTGGVRHRPACGCQSARTAPDVPDCDRVMLSLREMFDQESAAVFAACLRGSADVVSLCSVLEAATHFDRVVSDHVVSAARVSEMSVQDRARFVSTFWLWLGMVERQFLLRLDRCKDLIATRIDVELVFAGFVDRQSARSSAVDAVVAEVTADPLVVAELWLSRAGVSMSDFVDSPCADGLFDSSPVLVGVRLADVEESRRQLLFCSAVRSFDGWVVCVVPFHALFCVLSRADGTGSRGGLPWRQFVAIDGVSDEVVQVAAGLFDPVCDGPLQSLPAALQSARRLCAPV